MASSILDIITKILPFSLEYKVNNPSVPTGLPLYPTGDKPILFSPEAILFWLECAPVATAVDKIALEVSSIKPLIFDTQTEKYIDNHPIFDLLEKPDADITYKEFIHSIITFYLITGNVFLRAIGHIDNPPKTLRVVPSQGVTIVADFDGYARNITTRILALIDLFNRVEVKEQNQVRHRYYANDFKECYHIRTFNPYIGSNMVYGVSPLNHVFYEMKQYVDSSKHNLSTLQRGTRFSGIFSIKNRMLPKEQRQRMEEQINVAMGGSNNAGRTMLIDDDVQFQDLIKNIRDMDYAVMKQQVTTAIYNALKIPLPLINPEHMTLANMDAAKLLLYDNAVLPITNRIFEELTNFLMPRYGDKEGRYILTYRQDDIPALLPRKNEQIQIQQKSQMFTINELRNEYGADPIDGGNNLYGNATLVPIAEDSSGTYKVDDLEKDDVNTENVPRGTTEDEEADKEAIAVTKEKFVTVLAQQKDTDGTRRFTDDDIKEMAGRHYGD
jgi:HK97 family phage portal protein